MQLIPSSGFQFHGYILQFYKQEHIIRQTNHTSKLDEKIYNKIVMSVRSYLLHLRVHKFRVCTLQSMRRHHTPTAALGPLVEQEIKNAAGSTPGSDAPEAP